ncbi:MAG: hypothetical protein NTW94_04205 [Legionellales bacterium]|nr:hypothetical protein [Legionellales bacterium]
MALCRKLFFLLCFVLVQQVSAGSSGEHYYRNFWSPMFHSGRLSYCTVDGKRCGLAVASSYCKMMGYERAKNEIIDYNVGLTHYLASEAKCRGVRCDGFMLITCEGRFTDKPVKHYFYRSRRFVVPRFDNHRVDWCYKSGKGCGQRAAYSFCRRMGYMNAQSFQKQTSVLVTRSLGDQKICFGTQCAGFASITCFR